MKIESIKTNDKPTKGAFLYKIFIKVKEKEDARKIFKSLFEHKKMKIGAKTFSARVYLSYVNDKLEQYARQIVQQDISLKPSEEESKKSS